MPPSRARSCSRSLASGVIRAVTMAVFFFRISVPSGRGCRDFAPAYSPAQRLPNQSVIRGKFQEQALVAVEGFDFGKRSPYDSFPPAQQGGVVADALHIGQNVGGEQDRCGAADFAENIQDLFSAHWVQGAGGLAADPNLSLIGPQQAQHHFHGRGFSGSVLANEAEDAPLRYGHVQIVNDPLPAEGF